MRGKFVVFEGADGAGKSTQLALAAQWLQKRGIKVATSREPGGTPAGEKLRHLVLGEGMDRHSELFLMLAARRENVCSVIIPALMRGEWLLCDRFGDSTRAYQGGGRGIDESLIEQASAAAEAGAKPDLTFYLLGGDNKNSSVPLLPSAAGDETFEKTTADFYQRVCAKYRDLAAANKDGLMIRIDKNGIRRPRDDIAEAVQRHLAKKFKL
ncbi:MAG: dTMP kinase [Gammaproteobacteria bacterium]